MLAKRIIPCLDVNKGRVVKGINFVNFRDAGDPVEAAKFYNDSLADELVFLDITASSDDRSIMLDVVKRTAEQVFIPLTVGVLRMRLSEKIIIPLSVMFRFFPTVMDEAASINAAMKMRGIHIGGRNAGKMLEYRLVPLMTCCVKIGEELSAAALTRGLGGEVRRTNICKIGFHVQDYILLGIGLIPYILWIREVVM